jgi:hypothetical protein
MVTHLKKQTKSVAILALFGLVTALSFAIYLERTLQGNINYFMLPAQMFGVPSDLAERGIVPLYYGAHHTGWDGQFYYYIANDILGQKDTPKHIDSDAYRYQRVGLSLYAAIAAKVALQDWVSPKFFFLAYFLLVAAAVWVGARLFQSRGLAPWLILLWALSTGTQVTLFNALPDAAADAFLILALPLLFARRFWLAAIPLTFSVLSREAYLLVPVLIALVLFIERLKHEKVWDQGITPSRGIAAPLGKALRMQALYALAIPAGVYAAWWGYVTLHFGKTPGSQAHNILGWPLLSWADFFIGGLTNAHRFVGAGMGARFEAVGLALFLLVLVAAAWMALAVLRRDSAGAVIRGLAGASLALVALYACFGSVVIKHYTGYTKVTGVFTILLPLLWKEASLGARPRAALTSLLTVYFAVIAAWNFHFRFLPIGASYDTYTRLSELSPSTSDREAACFGAYSARVQLLETRFHGIGRWRARIFGVPHVTMKVALTNTGAHDYRSYHGRGAVMMSYHWVDHRGGVVQDGIRSAILPSLAPGETIMVELVSPLPRQPAKLLLSPVQEGCAWFHMAQPGVERVLPAVLKAR